MGAQGKATVRRWLEFVIDVWWPAGPPWEQAAPEIKSAYAADIARTHAARAQASYAILVGMCIACAWLEHRYFPERLVSVVVGLSAFALICMGAIKLMDSYPQQAITTTILTNNLLTVITCAYYAAVGGSAEMCALTLICFMITFLFFTTSGTTQLLSCIGTIVVFPIALHAGTVFNIHEEYLIGSVIVAAAMTGARAALIDAQRFAAFHRGEALRLSEANLRSIFDNLRDVFFRVGRRGTVEMISPSVARFGYRPEEIIGQSTRFLYPDRRSFNTAQGQLMETSGSGSFELTLPDRDGNPVPVSINAHVRVDADGAFAGIEGVIRDITDRKRAEEALRQHEAQLAHVARLSTLGEMAAGVAHELHQPLAAIVNFTSGCEHRLRADEHQRPEILHALEQISAQALRAGEIIRRIRRFIRKEEPSIDWVDINARVHNVVQLCDPDSRQLGVEMHLDLAPSLPSIRGNGFQLEEVLLNLVRNGFEAMQDNNGKPKRLSIRTTATDAGIQVTVTDTGVGMDSELADKAFTAFFSTKRNGLGLGLGISRSIVEEHGGRLLAAGDAEHGTTFHFTLPFSSQ